MVFAHPVTAIQRWVDSALLTFDMSFFENPVLVTDCVAVVLDLFGRVHFLFALAPAELTTLLAADGIRLKSFDSLVDVEPLFGYDFSLLFLQEIV